MSGLRVFEIHPGKTISGSDPLSHGLHVHAAVDRRLPVDIVRSIWIREGEGGRLQVEFVPQERAMYIGKYLAKARTECMKGRRLWAAFGACENASKVQDIVVDSRWTSAYKFLGAAIKGFDKLRWDERARVVTHFCMGENMGAALASIGMEQNQEGEEWRPSDDEEEEVV